SSPSMAKWSNGPMVQSPSHLRADDRRFEDQLAFHDTLDAAADAAVAFPFQVAEDVHPRGGGDLRAELAFLDAAEADEAGPADVLFRVERRHLGGRLDHDHARQQRPAGDVAG